LKLDDCEASIIVVKLQEDHDAKLLKLVLQSICGQRALYVYKQYSWIGKQCVEVLVAQREQIASCTGADDCKVNWSSTAQRACHRHTSTSFPQSTAWTERDYISCRLGHALVLESPNAELWII
jgi:hypothetical protein